MIDKVWLMNARFHILSAFYPVILIPETGEATAQKINTRSITYDKWYQASELAR